MSLGPEARLEVICLDGEKLCQVEAAEALKSGDTRLAAWWTGRALDFRRYLVELQRELAALREIRSRE